MVQILEGNSRGSQLGRALGAGIEKGASQAAEFAQQMRMKKFETNQRRNLINEIEGGSSGSQSQQPQDMKQQFLEALPKIEEQLGRDLTPQDLDELWGAMNQSQKFSQEMQKDPLAKAKQYAASGEHELARTATEEAKMHRKEETEKHGRHYDIAKKSLEHAGELARLLPQKEAALSSMKDAIQGNNLSYFSPDNLAEVTGIDAFRSPEGAKFKTASKEFFLGNTLRVGAKGLNQWFEKQVLDMGPKIGRSTPANLAVTEMLDMEMDIQKKEIEITNKIADEMEDKFGFIKRDLPQKVQKEVSAYAVDRQMQAKKMIEEIKSRYEPVNKEGHLMRDPAGNLRRVSAKDYAEAKKSGYRKE